MEDPGHNQDRRLEKSPGDGQATLETCLAPCLVISPEGVIQSLNRALAGLLQARSEDLEGQPFGRYFQIRGHFRLAELWGRLADGCVKAVPATLAYMVPGRVILARGFLCPVAVIGQEHFSSLVMLDGASSRRGVVADASAADADVAKPREPLKMSA